MTRHAQKKLNCNGHTFSCFLTFSTSFMTFVEDLSVIDDPKCNKLLSCYAYSRKYGNKRMVLSTALK